MVSIKYGTRDFKESHPHLIEFHDFLDEFNKETERGAALVAAALFDELLKRTIQAFLIKNKGSVDLFEGGNPPLGTFSSRISAAFAMGLISKLEFQDSALIRKIRNEFAHTIGMSFGHPKVVGLCASLHGSAKDYGSVKVNPRGQFSSAAVSLILALTNRPHYVSQKRLSFEKWPY